MDIILSRGMDARHFNSGKNDAVILGSKPRVNRVLTRGMDAQKCLTRGMEKKASEVGEPQKGLPQGFKNGPSLRIVFSK